MELEEVLQKRRSVRSFTKDLVSDADIEKLLHAAMSGPSAVNAKPWEFFVVTNPEKIKSLNLIGHANFPCPLIIVVCGNAMHFIPGDDEYWVEDCSAATENILLEATNLGLGACWCGVWPNQDRVKGVQRMLKLQPLYIPLNIIVIGHPNGKTSDPRDQYEDEKVHLLK
jgi:nitroreductase